MTVIFMPNDEEERISPNDSFQCLSSFAVVAQRRFRSLLVLAVG